MSPMMKDTSSLGLLSVQESNTNINQSRRNNNQALEVAVIIEIKTLHF